MEAKMRDPAQDNEVFLHVYMKSSKMWRTKWRKKLAGYPWQQKRWKRLFLRLIRARCIFSPWKRRQADVWWQREGEYHCCPVILWWFLVSGPCFFLSFHTQSYTFFRFDLWSYWFLGCDPWAGFLAVLMILIAVAHFPGQTLGFTLHAQMMPCWRKIQRGNKNSAFPQAWSCCISSIHENLNHIRSQNTEENISPAPSTFLCKRVLTPASFLSIICCLLIHRVLAMRIWVVAEFHFEIWGLFIGTGSTRSHLDWKLHPKVI